MKVICNTTPFIALASIDQLGLLKEIYSSVITPKAVIEEVSAGGPIRVPDIGSLDWIEVVPNVATVENRILFQLDYGERQVVLSALELRAGLVLIDDRNARNIAEYLGLRVKGTLGVLVEAKRRGLISSFRELAFKMKEQGIRFSEQLINEIFRDLKETH